MRERHTFVPTAVITATAARLDARAEGVRR
jgi:hypothetical protein